MTSISSYNPMASANSYRYQSASGKICRIPIVGPESARQRQRERVMAEGQPYPSTPRISGEGGVPAVAKMPAAVPVGEPVKEQLKEQLREPVKEPVISHRVMDPSHSSSNLLRCKTVNEWCREARGKKNPAELWLKTWYEGEVCCLFADSNLGKSIYAVQIAASIAEKGMRVLYFDFELTDKQFQLRYTDSEGEMHCFPETFFRADMKPDGIVDQETRFEDKIVGDIESMASYMKADVLIIDNITYLNSLTESADAASELMMKLLRLKKNYGWSILALAHTPKRQAGQPLSANDLAGSKRLFNFFDSVLAIGRSYRDENLRYVKQVKVRCGRFVYDYDNVIVCEIVSDGQMLCFRSLCTEPEKRHLIEPDDEKLRVMKQRMEALRGEGKSLRDISRELKVSYSRVQRMLSAPCGD